MTLPCARDVMSRPVRRLQASVGIREAAAYLLKQGISGAVVVDAHGRPAGVFSLRDIAVYVQNRIAHLPEVDPKKERAKETGEPIPRHRDFHFEAVDDVTVADVMTPGIITVSPGASLGTVARLMTMWKVHRVFVEERGELRGVVTSLDVLRWVDRVIPAASSLPKAKARRAAARG
jgi:tRNA nucleotidyltransferase (CCA-adding enzyme)